MLKLIKNLWSPQTKQNSIAAKIDIQEMPAAKWWK